VRAQQADRVRRVGVLMNRAGNERWLRSSDSQTLPPRRRKSSAPTNSKPLPGCDRRHVHDPFGNRIELIEPHPR
jgi:hypothetical protein